MSTRIAQAFARAQTENRAAFIPFIMAGHPSLETAQTLLNALPAAGADIIELGMPFSDPMADGPVIAAAGLRALEQGTKVHNVLGMVRAFRETNTTTPVVLMGYANPLFHYGYAAFAADAAKAGVDGLIVVDIPPEEAADLHAALSAHNLALIRLIAPPSIPIRLQALCEGASGYLYLISVAGITGTNTAARDKVAEYMHAIRAHTSLPVAVGFGIKTPEQVRALQGVADGVVVGSAIVGAMDAGGSTAALDLVKQMVDALTR